MNATRSSRVSISSTVSCTDMRRIVGTRPPTRPHGSGSGQRQPQRERRRCRGRVTLPRSSAGDRASRATRPGCARAVPKRMVARTAPLRRCQSTLPETATSAQKRTPRSRSVTRAAREVGAARAEAPAAQADAGRVRDQRIARDRVGHRLGRAPGRAPVRARTTRRRPPATASGAVRDVRGKAGDEVQRRVVRRALAPAHARRRDEAPHDAGGASQPVDERRDVALVRHDDERAVGELRRDPARADQRRALVEVAVEDERRDRADRRRPAAAGGSGACVARGQRTHQS